MSMRLFLAVDLPPSLAAGLRRCAEDVLGGCRGVRLTPVENLHVTVHFLGDVAEDRVGEAAAALRGVAAGQAPFALSFAEVRFAPRRGPRMLWAAFAPAPAFAAFAKAAGAASLPFMAEEPAGRGPAPHVTLARFKDPSCAAGDEPSCDPPDPSSFRVESCTLYSSTLAPEGPIYRPLERMPFAV
jgi:2'-5' RNA ligase